MHMYTYTYILCDAQRVKQLFNVIFLDGKRLKYSKNISTEMSKKSINNLLRYIMYNTQAALYNIVRIGFISIELQVTTEIITLLTRNRNIV